jgi:glycosyltransferase involved in cell wall biosynthesis
VADPLQLSVVIVAKNEAANLPRCLASVRGWTAEIVVVLNATTDASEALALAAGARVHHLPWSGFRDTKNAALALADRLHEDEVHGWTYEVHACARGFYVAVFDDDGHFMGTL